MLTEIVSSSRYRYLVIAFCVVSAGLYFTYQLYFSPSTMPGTTFTTRPPTEYIGHHFSSEARTPRANACFVILTRNRELESILSSVQHVEMHFNSRYHYPYVFLNDEPFTDGFQATVAAAVSGNVSFGLVPPEQWREPAWIDQGRAKETREQMQEAKVIYGGSESYRRMCRYQSGFFFRHELLQSYEWYWRVEPGIKYSCDINYDPFLFMQENNKVYGFTISMTEYSATIPTLWKTVQNFTSQHPEYIHPHNSMGFISNNGGRTYNLCHFWSNFEIASLKFLRSPAYMDYFEHLDKAGGFSYERWGDAPVHSIAAALFLDTKQLHFFDDIGSAVHALPFNGSQYASR